VTRAIKPQAPTMPWTATTTTIGCAGDAIRRKRAWNLTVPADWTTPHAMTTSHRPLF
jgi:hypothetical protein